MVSLFVSLKQNSILWQRFPAADGPGITAFKKLAGKVEVDMGDVWRTRHY